MSEFKLTPAAIYVRISDDPQLQKLGTARQERACRQLAQRLGWEVTHVYADDDRSAFKKGVKRAGYRQLLTDIRAGQWKGLIAWHPDRMHRQMSELVEFVDIVNLAGLRISTVETGELNLSTPAGRLQAHVTGAVASYESELKTARIKSKMAEIARLGQWKGGPRPFGWKNDGKTPIPGEVKILVEAKDRVLAGESLRGICMDFEKRGIKSARGRLVQPTALRKALLSPRVIGMYGKRDRTIVSRAVWKPIFSETDWRHLARLLTADARNTRSRRPPRKYLLTGGLLCCEVCGAAMFGRPAFGKRPHPYYGCKKATGYPGCGTVHIQVPVADEFVERNVVKVLASREFAAARRKRIDSREPALTDTVQKLDELYERRNDLARMFGDGEIKRAEWDEARKRLEPRITIAERVVSQAEARLAVVEDLVQPGQLAKEWPELPIERRRMVIRTLVEKVQVRPHKGPVRRLDKTRIHIVWRH